MNLGKFYIALLTVPLFLNAACGGAHRDEATDKPPSELSCDAEKACKTGYVCIAETPQSTTGTCKVGQTCTPTTVNQDCPDPAKNRCVEVQGVGSKLYICGSTSQNPTGKLKKGDTCTKADACESHLLCIATDDTGTTGTCQEEKRCSPENANQVCTDPTKNGCIEIQGVGSTLNICGDKTSDVEIKKNAIALCKKLVPCDKNITDLEQQLAQCEKDSNEDKEGLKKMIEICGRKSVAQLFECGIQETTCDNQNESAQKCAMHLAHCVEELISGIEPGE